MRVGPGDGGGLDLGRGRAAAEQAGQGSAQCLTHFLDCTYGCSGSRQMDGCLRLHHLEMFKTQPQMRMLIPIIRGRYCAIHP